MGKIKKFDNLHWWWGDGERGTTIHYWWVWKVVQPFWRKIWEYLSISNLISTQNSLCEFILNTYLQQYENIYEQLFTEYLPLSSTGEGLNKLIHTHNRELCSCDQEFYVLIWNDFLEISLMKKAKHTQKICYANFYVQNKGNKKKI